MASLANMATLQIREVPPDVHHTLKERAAVSGRSLSEYLLDLLAREARQPTIDEFFERVRLRESVDLGVTGVDTLRAERDSAR